MKRSVLVFSMTTLLVLGGLNMATAQEQPAPKKDTVNMDTEANQHSIMLLKMRNLQGVKKEVALQL